MAGLRWVGCAMQAEFDQVGSAYANALVELAQAKNALDAVHADVDALQVSLNRQRPIA